MEEKKTIEKKKIQRMEGVYLSPLASTFGMKHSSCYFQHSFNIELSNFLKPYVSRLF
jgi:hypothetical protein